MQIYYLHLRIYIADNYCKIEKKDDSWLLTTEGDEQAE